MIVSALDPDSNTIFISNEIKKLIPYLKEAGFSSNILCLEEYLDEIGYDKTFIF
jgi:hypothetical protein